MQSRNLLGCHLNNTATWPLGPHMVLLNVYELNPANGVTLLFRSLLPIPKSGRISEVHCTVTNVDNSNKSHTLAVLCYEDHLNYTFTVQCYKQKLKCILSVENWNIIISATFGSA